MIPLAASPTPLRIETKPAAPAVVKPAVPIEIKPAFPVEVKPTLPVSETSPGEPRETMGVVEIEKLPATPSASLPPINLPPGSRALIL